MMRFIQNLTIFRLIDKFINCTVSLIYFPKESIFTEILIYLARIYTSERQKNHFNIYYVLSHSVVSDSLWLHRLPTTRPLSTEFSR